jgi:transcriptional regulator with XRE-family HTH domain
MASRFPGRRAVTYRQRLGSRLRAIRELAGLRNEDIASAIDASPATVSRIESGERLIRTAELEAWITRVGPPADVREALLALAEVAADPNQVTPWTARVRSGADQTQQEMASVEAGAATIQTYDHAVVNGLLQVPGYARLVFELGAVDDSGLDSKVEGRLRRQSVLLDQSKQFTILMTEAALRWRPGTFELQQEQLQRVQAVMRLPNVRVGALPLAGQARVLYPENFQIYADRADDTDTLVLVELVSDEVTISEPGGVALYEREFDRLRTVALYNDAADELITRIAADLREEQLTGTTLDAEDRTGPSA